MLNYHYNPSLSWRFVNMVETGHDLLGKPYIVKRWSYQPTTLFFRTQIDVSWPIDFIFVHTTWEHSYNRELKICTRLLRISKHFIGDDKKLTSRESRLPQYQK